MEEKTDRKGGILGVGKGAFRKGGLRNEGIRGREGGKSVSENSIEGSDHYPENQK